MKPNIWKLNPLKFSKLTPNRDAIIDAASNEPVAPPSVHLANQIASALHPGTQYLKVSRVVERTPDTKSYYLVPDPDKGTEKLAWFQAGQYLSISLTVGSKTLTRPYSLASSPREALAGEYMLTVKRVEGGIASRYILDNWTAGTEVISSEPLGVFTYEPLRDAKTVIGVAGGSGITPFRSLAKAIADGDEDAKLILLYGSRTLADAIFQEEFKALEGPKFKLVNVLSHETQAECEHGFITAELIKKYAPEGGFSIFLCGPQAMYTFVDKEIETLGIRRKFIRHELFGEYFNPAREADYPKAVEKTYSLTVRMAGAEQTIAVMSDESLLRSMEAAGIAAPAHCRSGECGWCHSKLISGEVYTPRSVDGRREADLQYGYIHPCCTFPLSDLIIEVPVKG